MTRSTARTRLVVACVGTLGVFAAAMLAGCGAGQKAQTSRMQAAVPGTSANINVPGGSVALRDLTIAFPSDNGYPQGGTAPLTVRIFNGSQDPVTLTGVRVAPEHADTGVNAATPVNGKVVLVGNPVAAPSGSGTGPANASATPRPTNPAGSSSPSASASAARSPSPGGSASPSARTAPTGTPAPTATSGPTGSSTINVRIPVGGYVLLSPAYGSYLAVTDLSRQIRYGDLVNLEFQFGDAAATVAVPIMPPVSGGPRSPVQTDANR